MINLKIKDLVNSAEALQQLSKKQLKAKLAWQVSRILKIADTELQSFNDARFELIKKYGKKDENNELIRDDAGNCTILPDHINDFSNELKELTESEIEINANKIKIEDLDELDFTPIEMSQLEQFIDFGE